MRQSLSGQKLIVINVRCWYLQHDRRVRLIYVKEILEEVHITVVDGGGICRIVYYIVVAIISVLLVFITRSNITSATSTMQIFSIKVLDRRDLANRFFNLGIDNF